MLQYRGCVLLIVNLASKCGFTPQYESLQKLQDRYRNQEFKILGFPCNDFKDQEPGSEEEIREFCKSRYRVDFDLFAKIQILGADCHPLYRALQGANLALEADAGIKSALFKIFKAAWFRLSRGEALPDNGVQWNFHKFLVGRDGRPVAHFASETDPLDPAIISRIDKEISIV